MTAKITVYICVVHYHGNQNLNVSSQTWNGDGSSSLTLPRTSFTVHTQLYYKLHVCLYIIPSLHRTDVAALQSCNVSLLCSE